MKITEVLLGHFQDSIRVVYYFEKCGRGYGRGVVEFSNRTLIDILMWIEQTLGFEKERVTTVF